MGAGELAAEEFDETAGARASVGTDKAHAVEEDEELEDFGVFRVALGILRGGLFGFVEECDKCVVESPSDGWDWRLVVDDSGRECFVGFGQRLQRGENVRVGCSELRGAEFGNGECDAREKLRMDPDEIRSEADIKKRGVGWELAWVLFFVAMRGKEIRAIGRAVEGDFALRAAADGADGFGLRGAKATRFAFLADRTGQEFPLSDKR